MGPPHRHRHPHPFASDGAARDRIACARTRAAIVLEEGETVDAAMAREIAMAEARDGDAVEAAAPARSLPGRPL